MIISSYQYYYLLLSVRPSLQGAFTFSAGAADAGYSVEPDAGQPRLLGTPFAADVHSGNCYGFLHGGQV